MNIDTSVPGIIAFSRGGMKLEWSLPHFPINGAYVAPDIPASVNAQPHPSGMQTDIVYALTDGVSLNVRIMSYDRAPFWRLRYTLSGKGTFSTVDREMPIVYGALKPGAEALTEVQLSNFDRINHTFKPLTERYAEGEQFGRTFIGPIVLTERDGIVRMAAYEHGAEAPDCFLRFESAEDGLTLMSVKGNYFRGQAYEDYLSPWIELGVGTSAQDVQNAYRDFVMGDMSEFRASREPYIYYNTWNMQERAHYFRDEPYLSTMTQERVLREIDAAHEMGIEYFVLDTGWYGKTGDWEVNRRRFPDDMDEVRQRLEKYGMKLGLWFNPIVAAKTSRPRTEHPEWTMQRGGKDDFWGEIWETEESYAMCLVSDYADYFIEQLVRLHNTLGVCYFKWDAIGQYGCDCSNHRHGDASNSPQERLDAYAYRMGLQMIYIAGEVSRRCPGAIVDFDVTEGGRFVGLGFLTVGKYFLINNGPYFSSFDIPGDVSMQPNTINAFFYPGAARPQVCRAFTRYDPWIPSTLMLTHFLPDGDENARHNSMASMVLGGDGIWGELADLSAEECASWCEFISLYKLVRRDAAAARPITRGWAGASPEFHEKINPQNGRGLVCCFCRTGGEFVHITRKLDAAPERVVGADSFRMRPDGRAEIRITLGDNDARTVFLI